MTPPNSSGAEAIRRLGKNIDGYHGETIDLPNVLGDCVVAASKHGWTVSDIPVNEQLSLQVLTRAGRAVETSESIPSSTRVYISAGIHGDEPAGPLAVRQLLQENSWPAGPSYWICPCLNPGGFRLGRRENANGLDLNREYLQPQAAETRAHIAWLEQQPGFDLCLCLHEDWESHGFYVYELNPELRPSMAEEMVRRISAVCPIDLSTEIEGRAAHQGIIRPSIDPRDRLQWPESFYLLTHKTKLSYTLEAPSDFPMSVRVGALVLGVNAALQKLGGNDTTKQARGTP